MKLQPVSRSIERFRAGLMYLGIITVITIVIWVSVSIYASYSKPTIDPDIQLTIKPINPSLDSQVLIDYSSSRLRPPEQFQIVSIIKEGNQITQVLLDPYAIATPPPPAPEFIDIPETSSPSSEIIPEEEIILEEE